VFARTSGAAADPYRSYSVPGVQVSRRQLRLQIGREDSQSSRRRERSSCIRY